MPKLILVEDDPQVRGMLSETLIQEGYEVLEAANGREALVVFRDNPVDLVITDIIMPEQDGVETIHAPAAGISRRQDNRHLRRQRQHPGRLPPRHRQRPGSGQDLFQTRGHGRAAGNGQRGAGELLIPDNSIGKEGGSRPPSSHTTGHTVPYHGGSCLLGVMSLNACRTISTQPHLTDSVRYFQL